MGLSSKLSGYKPSGNTQGDKQYAQPQHYSPAQQQGAQPGSGGYPSGPSRESHEAQYSNQGNFAQAPFVNQQPNMPAQPASGYPSIHSGLNHSFNPQSQPSRFPSMTAGARINPPSAVQSGLYQPQYGAAPPHFTSGPPTQQYPPQQQQQQHGQSVYGQVASQQAPVPYGQPQYGHPNIQQQQSHGQQYGGNQQGDAHVSSQAIAKVHSIIQINGLQAFYPPQQLQILERRLSGIDFRALARKWSMNLELAIDLASLALYDIVIYADDSTSMKYADGGERIDDLKLILERVADVSTLFDDDGISIRAINSKNVGDGITTAAAAAAYVANLRFSGMTPLGTEMEKKILEPMVYAPIKHGNLPKPVLVVTITDGEPTNEPTQKIFSVIKNVKKVTSRSRYGPKAVAFSFAQVGKDMEAQEFLGRLDTDRDVGAMVDCTSYFELEAEEYKRKGVILTPEIWMVKMLVGAVDPSYDEQDE